MFKSLVQKRHIENVENSLAGVFEIDNVLNVKVFNRDIFVAALYGTRYITAHSLSFN